MKNIALVLLVALLAACSTEKQVSSPAAGSASIRIVVADTTDAMEAVTGSIESLGGHVATSEVWREGDVLRARLTLHVPSGSVPAALHAIRDVAQRVERETVAIDDHCAR